MKIKTYDQIVEELNELHQEVFETLPGLVEASVKENIYKGSDKFSITLMYNRLPSSIETKVSECLKEAGYKNITLSKDEKGNIKFSFLPETF